MCDKRSQCQLYLPLLVFEYTVRAFISVFVCVCMCVCVCVGGGGGGGEGFNMYLMYSSFQ